MAEIRWTEEAYNWLKEIFDHIAADDPDAAQRVILSLYDRIQTIRTYPNIGYRYESRLDSHIRVLIHGHYRIAYLVEEDQDVVIIGIFHGALDIGKYLR